MFLIYVDESGKPNFKDKENYIISGLIINETEWQEIDKQVKIIKKNNFKVENSEDIEIHVNHIVHRKGFFKNFNDDQIYNLLEEIYILISKIKCCIISIVIEKFWFSDSYGKKIDMEKRAFKFLFERVCKYLIKSNESFIEAGYGEENAIILIDSVEKKYDKKLRSKILNLFNFGTEYVKNEYLIEDPLFVSSQYRNMSQLVDAIAYCVRRYFRNKKTDKLSKKFLEYYNIIYQKFDTDKFGEVNGCGIKIYPEKDFS